MAFESNNRKIYSLLNDKCFIVPLNQRKYVWKEVNWNELWEDIKLVEKKKIGKHFLGSIVLKNEKEKKGIKNNYSIIDGQQRILTLTIVICALGILYLENENYKKLSGLDKHLTLVDIDGKHLPLISKDANIKINEIVCKIHSALKNKQKLTINDFVLKTNPLEVKCLKFFYGKIKGESFDQLSKTITDIEYIEIIATSVEDAYSIFEVLNARGQELGDFDLLRNYVLKCSKDKKGIVKKLEEIENKLGNDVEIFLKHYIKHKYEKTHIEKSSRPYKVFANEIDTENIVDFVDDLYLKSDYYSRIINPIDETKVEYKVFNFFKSRRQQQLRPVIIGLMHQVDLGGISSEEYENAIENLYRFFICYFIIGKEKSNKIDDIVDGYSYIIENNFNRSNTIKDFMSSIFERIPNKEYFTDNLKAIRYSHKYEAYSGSKNRTNVFVILELIEQIKYTDFSLIYDDYNIEHCNPDSDNENNSILGNLILLETRINEKMGNKQINEKSSYYRESQFTLTKEAATEIDNGIFDMNKRTEKYSDILYEFIKEKHYN